MENLSSHTFFCLIIVWLPRYCDYCANNTVSGEARYYVSNPNHHQITFDLMLFDLATAFRNRNTVKAIFIH